MVQQGHELAVLSISLSADSNYAVSTSKDKSAKLWELQTGREVRSFLGHQASVTCAALSADARYLLTGSNDKQVKIWEVQTGKEMHSIFTGDYITDIALHPSGKYFVCAGYNDSGYGDTAVVYDFQTRAVIKKIFINPDKGLGKGVNVAFSRSGKWLAVGEDNRKVQLYETAHWQLVRTIDHLDGFCGGCGTFVSFFEDSFLMIASENGNVKRFDLNQLVVEREFPIKLEDLEGIAISPDGKAVAVSTEAEVKVLDANTGHLISLLQAKERAAFHRVAFRLDGKTLFIACDNNTVLQWNSEEKMELPGLTGFLTSRDKGGLNYDPNFYWESHIAKYVRLKNPILITSDGKSLIKGKFGPRVRELDIATGEIRMEFTGHNKAVLAYDLSRDGKLLLTGGGDGKIILWDRLTGDSIRVIRSYNEPIFDIHFSRDESMALSSSWDATMKIHDLHTGKMLHYFPLENYSAFSLLFHPNDLYIVTGRLDNSLQMWEVDTKTIVRTFVGHTSTVSTILLLKDHKTLLSGSWDGTIRLWDVSSGLMTKKIIHSASPVHTVVVTHDERFIISAGADRVIKVWDMNTGTLARSLEGHQSEITTLLISPDEATLISHSVDGVTKFWNLQSGHEFFEHIQIGDKDWLVKNKEGYFNGTDGARKFVHFVKGTKTYSVDQFFNEFYRPDLLPKIFQSRGGDRSKGVETKINRSPPAVVKIALLPINKRTVQVLVRMYNEGAGVQSLRVLHNGKSISLSMDNLQYPAKTGDFTTYKQDVELIGGNNIFTAVASNMDNVESDPRSAEIFSESEIKHGVCHILAVGINQYKNPKLNLNYAKPDAVSFSKIIDEQSIALFKEIKVHTLYDGEASRSNILTKLDEISHEVYPEDVFIFYYAGHGSIIDNKFYFIPSENLRLYDQNGLAKDGIEAGLIQEKLKNIAALKQLIVMDACQSGGSVELLATRGANEEKAIAQLSRSAGIHVLASAGSEQFAAEFGELGHGLFTYVLIKGLQGEADGAPKDGKVTIYELKSYIDDQVPEMTRRMKGKPQYPYTFSRGQDFPVVMKRKGE